MKVMEVAYKSIERQMKPMAADMIFGYGVPTTIDQAHEMADQLYPEIMSHRRKMISEEAESIAKDHPFLIIPEGDQYSLNATRKMVRNSAGLAPKPRLAQIEMFDPETQDMQLKSVAPWVAPDMEDMQVEMARRLATATARHIKGASRELVIRTAQWNKTGWARQLSGSENCSFCALLTTRGAVYSKETVNFRTHDHCDCTATLVENGDWEGRDQAAMLLSLWKASKDAKEFSKVFREEFGFVGMAA